MLLCVRNDLSFIACVYTYNDDDDDDERESVSVYILTRRTREVST